MTPNTNLSVNLTPELRFGQALKKAGIENPSVVTRLTVTGTITDDDFRYIRQNMGKTLLELDLSKAYVPEHFFFSDFSRLDFTHLTSLILPDTFVRTEIYCDRCAGLTSIMIHPDNPVYASENGVLYNKDKTRLIHYPKGRLGEYLIPASVVDIDRYFSHCPGLTAITTHPDNPVYASENGVLYNKDMTELLKYPEGRLGDYFIPASAIKIGRYPFSNCSGLTSITVHPDNPVYASENGVLFNKNKTVLIRYPVEREGAYIIPASVVKYKAKVFGNVFGNCRGLTSVVISASMTEIKEYMFHDCVSLTSVVIPESVHLIEGKAFFGCTALTALTVHPDNLKYSSEDGILFNKNKTILLFCPRGRQGDYIIPDTVVEIGTSAFEKCTGLTSITFPDSVKIIGDDAFRSCTGLKNVALSDSVLEIGGYAFSGCTGLSSIFIPQSVVKITHPWEKDTEVMCPLIFPHGIEVHPDNPMLSSADGVLFNKNKTLLIRYPNKRQGSYNIPGSVVEIGKEAFSCCTGLTSVNIPDSVVKINPFAFSDCTGLTSVNIPDSVVDIGDYAFRNCSGLTTVTIPDSVVTIRIRAFESCNLTSVSIPRSVKNEYGGLSNSFDLNIFFDVHPDNSDYASDNGFLFSKDKTILYSCPVNPKGGYAIPDSVVKIEGYLSHHAGLATLNIPASLSEFDKEFFPGYSTLTSIKVHPDNPFFASREGVLFNKDMTELILCPQGRQGDFIIPDTVLKIGEEAFKDCTGLTAVTIPDSVTEIGYNAFDNCVDLTSIMIPASVTKIIGSASETDITESISWDCPAIITIHPKNRVFEVENGEKRTVIKKQIFSVSVTLTQRLRLEQALKKAGVKKPTSVRRLTVTGMFTKKDFLYICEKMPKKLQELDLSNATIRSKHISDSGFSGCTGLISILLSKTIQSIDRRVFASCVQLTSITVHPDNPYYASDNGVLYNKEMTILVKYPLARQSDYEIPDSVTKIDMEAFRGCTGIASVTFPDDSLWTNKWRWMRNGSTVTIPDAIVEIGQDAFRGCTGLSTVSIPDSVTEIGKGAFDGCPAYFMVHPDNPNYTSVEGVLSDKTI